jgi:hypothetical protein
VETPTTWRYVMKGFAVGVVLLVAGLGTGAGVLSAQGGADDTARQRSYVGASGPLSGTPSHQLIEKALRR